MQKVLSFLLAFVFMFNTAYAGVSGVRDMISHSPQGEAGLYQLVAHHDHDVQEIAAANQTGDNGTPADAQSPAGHCHSHCASAAGLLTAALTLPPFFGSHIFTALTATAFVSAIPASLDRPPRTRLA